MNSNRSEIQGFITLFRRLPVASMLTRVRDSCILAVNPAFEQLFGWRSSEVVDLHSSDLPIWTSLDQRTRYLSELVRLGSVQQAEARFLCSDGQIKPCLMYIELIEVNGELCRLSMVHDISERIQAEQALKRSEAKFAALFMDSPEPYILFDKGNAQVAEINRRFTEVFGYQPEEVKGKTALEVELWRYPEKRPAIIKKLLREGCLRSEPIDFITRDGRVRHCEVSSNFILIGEDRCTLSCFKDVTEQVAIEARIKHQAYHDALTNLPNRLLLQDRLAQHLALGQRHDLRFALLFFDLDHFKRVNDSLGHSCGDAVLQEISHRLSARVRAADTVARLGGDEFVILLTGLSGSNEQIVEQARRQAMSLLEAVAMPMNIQGHVLQLNCSIGIALSQEHGVTPEDLLKHADTALYGVKASGRNNIAFFEPQMQVIASQRLQLEADLHQALKEEAFCLHYQPQVDAREQRIMGVEALLRWEHPVRGLIGPLSFMHVLEESGMILQLGHWLLREAIGLIARLLEQGLISAERFSMSVNISPRQFRQVDFVAQVTAAIAEQQIPARCLQLEITESIAIHNIQDTVEKMHELRKLGIRFAIDDFGTGYSSLSYLKRLPVDQLKIDKSFVNECTLDSNDAEIIRAIIAMARSMKMDLIAEGVETTEQLAFLQKEDCHAYQGYLFSPAVIEDELCEMLRLDTAAVPL